MRLIIASLIFFTGCSDLDRPVELFQSVIEKSRDAGYFPFPADPIDAEDKLDEEVSPSDIAFSTETVPPDSDIFTTSVPEGLLCDLAGPGKPLDVSVPDGTKMVPEQFFTKTWRLQNLGACPWSENYSLVWFSGSMLGTSQSVNLYKNVEPGGYIDISIDLTAPNNPGFHQSNWKLRNEEGVLFGIGPDGDYPIWVKINVIEVTTPTGNGFPTDLLSLNLESSGELSLAIGDSVDLFTGIVINTSSVLDSGEEAKLEVGDIRFRRDLSGKWEILALNNARVNIYGFYQPEFRQCQSLKIDKTSIPIDAFSDNYICYKTNPGLIGFARLVEILEEEEFIVIEYQTWKLP